MKIKNPRWFVYINNSLVPDISITTNHLIWKDKWDTPRVELCPAIRIRLWKVEICIQKGTAPEWSKYLWDKYYRKRFGNYPWI